MLKIALDSNTHTSINLFLVSNVQNLPELRKEVLGGNLNCCILKASLIVDPLQIVVAANKAALSLKGGKLATRSRNTELLFNLSSNRKISQSLQTFGATDDDKHCVVVAFQDEIESGENIVDKIKGDHLKIEELSQFTDEAAVKKVYQISEEELKVSSLLNSVISRIAIRDLDVSK